MIRNSHRRCNRCSVWCRGEGRTAAIIAAIPMAGYVRVKHQPRSSNRFKEVLLAPRPLTPKEPVAF
jgi:hypothetical protein